jgi:hypothetical protein
MAKKRETVKGLRQKQTFGGARVDYFSPVLPETTPKAINIVLSFEDALKLHLGLGQLLGKLNAYDRSTSEGRRTAANLCVYTQAKRIVIVQDKINERRVETRR